MFSLGWVTNTSLVYAFSGDIDTRLVCALSRETDTRLVCSLGEGTDTRVLVPPPKAYINCVTVSPTRSTH